MSTHDTSADEGSVSHEHATPDAGPPRRRGSPFRRRTDDGPKAKLSELWGYLFARPGLIVAAVALSILSAGTSLVQPLLVQQIIDGVTVGAALGTLITILIVVVVADALVSGFQHFLLQVAGEHVVLTTRRTLVQRILRLPIAEFDRRRTGDLISRVGSDTTLLRAVLTQGLIEAIGGMLTIIGAVIAMIIIDGLLFGLSLLVVVVAFGLAGLFLPMLTRASTAAQEQVGQLTSALERSISAIRTVRAAGATERETALIEERAEGAYRAGIKIARISAVIAPIAFVAMQLAFLVVLGVGGLRVASDELPIGSLVAFLMFLFLMVAPLMQLFGALTAISVALGALGRIQEIVRLPEEDGSDTVSIERTPDRASDVALAFDRVSFRYPHQSRASADESVVGGQPRGTADAPTLDAVSFSVPRGSRTAIVGPSGAGKSTIFALIERFYPVESGVIALDGRDITTLPRTVLRAGLGYVEQDAPVLAGTIRDNLRLAAPDADEAAMQHVLDRVNLRDVLDRSADGLDAVVGERGIMLSGGERQRLAIARALLAAPPLLLLDESTSSLDGRNEAAMRDAIDEVATGRTLLVIAHRLSTVVDSDQIVVLDRGRVLGVGTHAELIERVPLYRELAAHQLLVPEDDGADRDQIVPAPASNGPGGQ